MILYVDACARENSRTRRLAKEVLKRLGEEVKEVSLYTESIAPMDEEKLGLRDSGIMAGDFSGDIFRYARDFREADTVVVAAPYWDLSFPSLLKEYIENISVTGLTFKYSEEGVPVGLCKAKRLYYVTTAGGKIYDASFGFGYIKAISEGMFGIKECILIKAEELDILGNDAEEIVERAIEGLDSIIK